MFQIGQDLQEDPRLNILKKEWFEDKDCLDIGCNSGIITISIGNRFSTETSILYYDTSFFVTSKPFVGCNCP